MPDFKNYPFVEKIEKLGEEFPGASFIWIVLVIKGIVTIDELREIGHFIQRDRQEFQEAWDSRPRSLMDKIFGL